MKDIILLFCLALAIILSVTTLDHALNRISDEAARSASHDLPGFYTSLDAARTAAEQAGKPLAVVFGRRDDLKTQKLKSDVLNSSSVNAVKSNFVWAYLDLDQEHNKNATAKFDLFDIPVTCIINSEGRTVQRIQGTSMPHLYARQLQFSFKSLNNRTKPSNSLPGSAPSKQNQHQLAAPASPSK
jgi:Thioredoxin-like